jgi:hypothetical protein
LLLIIGFVGFSSLLKTNFSKLIFALIWFLPVERFVDLLRYPIGVQYCLLGFIIFLINKVHLCEPGHKVKNHLLLTAIGILTITTVWVSDLSIVSLIILSGTMASFHLAGNKRNSIKRTVLYYAVITTVAGFLFILFAKRYTGLNTGSYYSISGLQSIHSAFCHLMDTFAPVVGFNNHYVFLAIYMYMTIIIVFLVFILLIHKKAFSGLLRNKWFVFLLADFLIVFLILLSSGWVKANGMAQRYFIGNYIMFSLALLLALDHLEARQFKVLSLKVILLAIAIIGSISTVYSMKFVNPKTLKPMAKVVGEYRELGQAGIIGHYWTSYIASCSDPEMIIATPHESGGFRNKRLADLAMQQENIYVISKWWLDSFPDSLVQFGYVLKKDGLAFDLGGQTLCKYRKASKVHTPIIK